jgi:hypothetical protein
MDSEKTKAQLESMTATYSQEDDCCYSSELGTQKIEISIQDGGGGMYYILATDRWAFDTIEDLTNLINQFINKTK